MTKCRETFFSKNCRETFASFSTSLNLRKKNTRWDTIYDYLTQIGESGKETTVSHDFWGFYGSSIPQGVVLI